MSTAEKVLIFMVESGALYLGIWVCFDLLTVSCPLTDLSRQVVYMTLSFIQWFGGLIFFIDAAIVQIVVSPPSIVL